MQIDDRDLKILTILQREGRIAKTELAARVNLSPTPCWERLKKLEQAGIIKGYAAEIALEKFGEHTLIFMEIELTSHRHEDFEKFESTVDSIAEIVECWAVGGGIDYILKLVTRNIEAYQDLVDDLLKADIGIERYFTRLVTKPIKNAPFPPLDILRSGGSPKSV